MENEKLTLRLEKELIAKAKRFAREHETSVSRIVADFFDNLQESGGSSRYGPITTRLRGSLRTKDESPHASEDDYRRYLEEKHG